MGSKCVVELLPNKTTMSSVISESMAAAGGQKAMTKRVVEDLAVEDTEEEGLIVGVEMDANADANLTSVPQTILNTVR